MRRPTIFLYSLLFPAAWIGVSVLFTITVPGKNIGTVGTALLIGGAASVISWLFARREGRDFSTSEYRAIILYCIGWALLLESLALFLFLQQPEPGHDLSVRTLCFVALVTVPLDSLFVWLAFRNFGRRVIRSYLAQRQTASTSGKEDHVA
jgi:hypothetical protein